ncbi:D-3-phosphoglycerate dehydrogenase [Cyphellophora attinorum]|uniref:D-3-phosphoglycerate dehydrogenase n=1 Tax=Cyphellophora attinorum TaxID=1664694 RepID=A0A0N0NLA7_9EURO|nr:D-3-phosphoglycerate dehydrogenase [Phialophora attinorum]KPI38819.1 D-3-phosphoglycerate dehydrogenase [Phialophora attinorum]
MSASDPAANSLAILDDYHSIALKHFTDLHPTLPITLFPDTLHPLHSEQDHAALIARLKPFTIISTMRERTPLPASILTQLPNLRLLLTTGNRNLGIDEVAAYEAGVTYTGTVAMGSIPPKGATEADLAEIKDLRGRYSATNEHTFALLLSLAKYIPSDDYRIKAQPTAPWQTDLVTGLAGKVFGCIGLGRLGAQAAITARLGFGMRVLCWSPNLKQERCDEVAKGVGLPAGTFKLAGSLKELMEGSDVVSVHVVLSPRSKGMLSARELSWLKPSALLINTSRGPLIDETALLDVCSRGAIRGVGLDVYEREHSRGIVRGGKGRDIGDERGGVRWC